MGVRGWSASPRVCVGGGSGGSGRTWRRERAPGGGGALAADSLPLSAAGKGAGLPVFVGNCGAWRRCGGAGTLYVEVKATETLLRCMGREGVRSHGFGFSFFRSFGTELSAPLVLLRGFPRYSHVCFKANCVFLLI